MFDTIGGIPVHALMVHVPIVLIPLSAIGAILIAARPKALRLFGAASVIGAVVGVVASIIAKLSGQELAQRIGWPQDHTDYGNLFPWAATTFLLLLLIFLVVRPRNTAQSQPSTVAQSIWRNCHPCLNWHYLLHRAHRLFRIAGYLVHSH